MALILGKWLSHTVTYFFHYKGVEADLVNALVQTVGLIDLLHLLMKHHLLWVRQLWAQNPIVEFLWEVKRVRHLSLVVWGPLRMHHCGIHECKDDGQLCWWFQTDCVCLRGERRAKVGLLLWKFSAIESMADITATPNWKKFNQKKDK